MYKENLGLVPSSNKRPKNADSAMVGVGSSIRQAFLNSNAGPTIGSGSLKNGRPDRDYLYWEWQLDDCNLPRFDVIQVLKKLRGKRPMFIGDSLHRGQWQSFVCLVQTHIPPEEKLMNRSRTL